MPFADTQQMLVQLIFTDAKGRFIDDDGANVAPPPDGTRTSGMLIVDPADYLHNLPLPPVDGIHDSPPPNFKMHPVDSGGANVLPNESYFLPLADWDNELERLVSKYMMRMSECYLTKRGHNVFIVQWLNCHLLLYSVSKTFKHLWRFLQHK